MKQSFNFDRFDLVPIRTITVTVELDPLLEKLTNPPAALVAMHMSRVAYAECYRVYPLNKDSWMGVPQLRRLPHTKKARQK